MGDEVAVVHHDLTSKGGGEAVAMTVLEALQDHYDLTLITLTDPDLAELNDFFQSAVDDISIEIAGRLGPWLHERYGLKYYVLQNALLGRYAREQSENYDLIFSTINELGLESDSIQYIHFPFDWTVSLPNRDHIFHPKIESDSPYERLCTRIAGVTVDDIQSNTLLANSEWTASVVEDAYDVSPEVVYPPVDTRSFDPKPWGEREPGFVSIGRIERSKRIVELIEVVDRLRERGHETHVHVIGPTVDNEYAAEVAALASSRQHVELEGEVARSELVERVCSHRYGIHGKKYEHFGMAVAELVAAGCVTFVPAEGGQGTIVGDSDRLCYESIDDAVEKTDDVLSRDSRPADLRYDERAVRRQFGRERFKEEIRRIVARELEGTSAPQTPRQTVSAGVTPEAED